MRRGTGGPRTRLLLTAGSILLLILGSSVLGVGATPTTSPATTQLQIQPVQGGQQNDSHINDTQPPIGTKQPIPVSTNPEAIPKEAKEYQPAAESHKKLPINETEEIPPAQTEETSGTETQRNLGNLENKLIRAELYQNTGMHSTHCTDPQRNTSAKQERIASEGIIRNIRTKTTAIKIASNVYHSPQQICHTDKKATTSTPNRPPGQTESTLPTRAPTFSADPAITFATRKRVTEEKEDRASEQICKVAEKTNRKDAQKNMQAPSQTPRRGKPQARHENRTLSDPPSNGLPHLDIKNWNREKPESGNRASWTTSRLMGNRGQDDQWNRTKRGETLATLDVARKEALRSNTNGRLPQLNKMTRLGGSTPTTLRRKPTTGGLDWPRTLAITMTKIRAVIIGVALHVYLISKT